MVTRQIEELSLDCYDAHHNVDALSSGSTTLEKVRPLLLELVVARRRSASLAVITIIVAYERRRNIRNFYV